MRIGRVGIGRVRIGRVGIGRVRIGRVGIGRVGIGRVRIGCMRIGRVRIGRVGIGRVRIGCVRIGGMRIGVWIGVVRIGRRRDLPRFDLPTDVFFRRSHNAGVCLVAVVALTQAEPRVLKRHVETEPIGPLAGIGWRDALGGERVVDQRIAHAQAQHAHPQSQPDVSVAHRGSLLDVDLFAFDENALFRHPHVVLWVGLEPHVFLVAHAELRLRAEVRRHHAR